jgi:hypothetical protein
MSSQTDFSQLSYQEKKRMAKGHRRTQSNSEYDFKSIKVGDSTNNNNQGKNDLEKMIEIHKVLDANKTKQALEASNS